MTQTELPYRSRRIDGDRISNRAQSVAYAAEHYARDGKTYAADEVRFQTAKRAIAYLDRIDVPGDVEIWNEHNQRRTFVARRYRDGSWSWRQANGAFEPELRAALS